MTKEDLKKGRILVVDDKPNNLILLKDVLEDAGFDSVHILSDPEQVLGECTNDDYDLILLDLHMPKMSGFQVIRTLKVNLGNNCPQIIVITAYDDEQNRYQALDLGAMDFIEKPFNTREVVSRVLNLLQIQLLLREQNNQVFQKNTELARKTKQLKEAWFLDNATNQPNQKGLELKYMQMLSNARHISLILIKFENLDELSVIYGITHRDRTFRAATDKLSYFCKKSGDYLGIWAAGVCVILSQRQPNSLVSEYERLIQQHDFQHPVIDGYDSSLNPIAGMATSKNDKDLSQLVSMAYSAMLTSNDDRVVAFDERINALFIRDAEIKREVRKVLLSKDIGSYLEPYFQPIVRAVDHRLSGAEMLIRLKEPNHTFNVPEFVNTAEKLNLIHYLTHWVLHEAIRKIDEIIASPTFDDDFKLSVNVSSLDMYGLNSQYMLDYLRKIEKKKRCCLKIELTESTLIESYERVLESISKLKELGVETALDDFGTGFSSLSYLSELPVSTVKIDKSFIEKIETPSGEKMVCSVVNLAKGMGLQTVAEGVETIHQLQSIQVVGVDWIQGYYFSKPLEWNNFISFARNHSNEWVEVVAQA